MNGRIVLIFALVVAGSFFTSTAEARNCGQISASASGHSEKQALRRANRQGLQEVRKLDRRYNGKVRYKKAKWHCSGGRQVECTITQRYCVAGWRD